MRDISQENYRLISDLLSLSKIERGVLTVDLGPVSLKEIVELTVRDYGPLIERKGLEFKVKGPEQGTEVLADQDKTVETLRNILNNAVKCTDKGSISVNWGQEDGFGWITIADTGIGMDQETLGRLFTKSRVLGPEAGRSGAGLGLYIAKNFMEIQKGEISVDSTPGRGTTFRIKLPVNRP
jgi:signal transduction histidine kinase